LSLFEIVDLFSVMQFLLKYQWLATSSSRRCHLLYSLEDADAEEVFVLVAGHSPFVAEQQQQQQQQMPLSISSD
jgi:hypothetical protein